MSGDVRMMMVFMKETKNKYTCNLWFINSMLHVSKLSEISCGTDST